LTHPRTCHVVTDSWYQMVILIVYTETERIKCDPYGHRFLLCIVSGFKGIKSENMDFTIYIKKRRKMAKTS